MTHFFASFGPYLGRIGVFVGGIILALLAHRVLFYLARQIARRTRSGFQKSLIRHSRRPTGIILPLAAALLVLPSLSIAPAIGVYVERLLILGLIASVAWLCARLTNVAVDLIDVRNEHDVRADLRARKIHTQVQVLRRIAAVGIVIFAGALMLMTFPTVRHIGITLFASAGVAGVVAGMAARSTFANLLAGFQIALTEPIRLEDVVIVEGEWGRIEEIGTTYVVVRIWDLRRLVVPLSYFIEKPFQNWTRTTSDLLGTVFVYADYTVPVEEVRTELQRILQSSGMWDGKTWGLQVTNADAHTLELRALMSAPDSGNAWDLRCHVREKLIAFLQRRYPQSLPRARADVSSSKWQVASGE